MQVGLDEHKLELADKDNSVPHLVTDTSLTGGHPFTMLSTKMNNPDHIWLVGILRSNWRTRRIAVSFWVTDTNMTLHAHPATGCSTPV